MMDEKRAHENAFLLAEDQLGDYDFSKESDLKARLLHTINNRFFCTPKRELDEDELDAIHAAGDVAKADAKPKDHR